MRTSCYSIATDGSNNQGLQDMNPVTVRLFDINQHKVTAKFYAMMRNNIIWENCVSLVADDSSLNVRCINSVIVEARKSNEHIILMGCPCHIPHNAASKATKAFVE